MADRGPRPGPGQRLLDELWPTPEPPRGLADKVVGKLQREAAREAAVAAQPPRAPSPYRRATIWAGLTTAAAAGVLVAAALVGRGARGPHADDGAEAADSDGHLVASARQTVNIGTRGAAALEPGADVAWSVRGRKVRVKQRRGSVFYRVERGGPFRVSTPGGEVEVTGTCFRVTLPAAAAATSATLVSVLEGTVKVQGGSGREARQLAISAGQAARLQPGRPPELVSPEAGAPDAEAAADQQLAEQARQAAAGKRASLLLPLSPRVTVFGEPLDAVSLALPRRNARVEVARDREFKQAVYAGPARAGFVTVPAPARGDLYWRLAGSDAPAGHARFLPESRRALLELDSPHNEVSESKESTTIYFQSAPPELTFSFEPAAGAQRYLMRVYRAAELERPVFQRVVSEPRASLRAGTLGEGRYLWTALPLDAGGREVGGGRLNKLELVYDNALRALAITRPRPGEPLPANARAVDVEGVAPLGARLYVNDRPAPLDGKGRFAMRIGPAPAQLVFRLVTRTGRDTHQSYWVRRLPR
jgi:ferric-dicitrate binding protein FerR (iron transport regulator)